MRDLLIYWGGLWLVYFVSLLMGDFAVNREEEWAIRTLPPKIKRLLFPFAKIQKYTLNNILHMSILLSTTLLAQIRFIYAISTKQYSMGRFIPSCYLVFNSIAATLSATVSVYNQFIYWCKNRKR